MKLAKRIALESDRTTRDVYTCLHSSTVQLARLSSAIVLCGTRVGAVIRFVDADAWEKKAKKGQADEHRTQPKEHQKDTARGRRGWPVGEGRPSSV